MHELEERLPFQFFKLEWDPEGGGGKSNTYRQLTIVESYLPALFGLFFLGILAFGIYSTC